MTFSTVKRSLAVCIGFLLITTFMMLGASAAELTLATAEPIRSYSQAPADRIIDGLTLECDGYGYMQINSSLDSIANAGYTSIKVNTIQPAKSSLDPNYATLNGFRGEYWAQSYSIASDDAALFGTADELRTLCENAHAMELKVILEVICVREEYINDNGIASISHPMPDIEFLRGCIELGVDGFYFVDVNFLIEENPDFLTSVIAPLGVFCCGDTSLDYNGIANYPEDMEAFGRLYEDMSSYMALSRKAFDDMLLAEPNLATWDNVTPGFISSKEDPAIVYSVKDVTGDELYMLWAYLTSYYQNMSILNTAQPGSTYIRELRDSTEPIPDGDWNCDVVSALNKFHNYHIGRISNAEFNESNIAITRKPLTNTPVVMISENADYVGQYTYLPVGEVRYDIPTGTEFTSVLNERGLRVIDSVNGNPEVVAVMYRVCEHRYHDFEAVCESCNEQLRHEYGADGYCTNFYCDLLDPELCDCSETRYHDEIGYCPDCHTAYFHDYHNATNECKICGALRPAIKMIYFEVPEEWGGDEPVYATVDNGVSVKSASTGVSSGLISYEVYSNIVAVQFAKTEYTYHDNDRVTASSHVTEWITEFEGCPKYYVTEFDDLTYSVASTPSHQYELSLYNYETVVTEPGCTTEGEVYASCRYCYDISSDVILRCEPIGHDLYDMPEDTACGGTGLAAHWCCYNCDLRFADGEGKLVVSEDEIERLPTDPHPRFDGIGYCISCYTLCEHEVDNNICTICGVEGSYAVYYRVGSDGIVPERAEYTRESNELSSYVGGYINLKQVESDPTLYRVMLPPDTQTFFFLDKDYEVIGSVFEPVTDAIYDASGNTGEVYHDLLNGRCRFCGVRKETVLWRVGLMPSEDNVRFMFYVLLDEQLEAQYERNGVITVRQYSDGSYNGSNSIKQVSAYNGENVYCVDIAYNPSLLCCKIELDMRDESAGWLTIVEDFSLAECLENMLENPYDDTEASYAELVKSMLVLAGRVQEYFDYNTDTPISTELAKTRVIEEEHNYFELLETDENFEYLGMSMSFDPWDSFMQYKFYIKPINEIDPSTLSYGWTESTNNPGIYYLKSTLSISTTILCHVNKSEVKLTCDALAYAYQIYEMSLEPANKVDPDLLELCLAYHEFVHEADEAYNLSIGSFT